MNEQKAERIYELMKDRKKIDEELSRLLGDSPKRGRPPIMDKQKQEGMDADT